MKKIVFIFLLIIAQSCQKELIDVSIDNPTKEAIEFYIDEQKVKIAATTEIAYKLSEGIHNLNMGDKTQEFVIKADRYRKLLINPSGSLYVLSESIYQLEGESIDFRMLNNARIMANERKKGPSAAKRPKMLLIDTINIAGVKLIGLYKKHNELVIQEDWNYGPNEDVPKQVKTQYMDVSTEKSRQLRNLVNGYPGRIKLYRAVDLLTELKEEYDDAQVNFSQE